VVVQGEISDVAALLGDPARAKMMVALLGGKALTATEMALEADITPQTASGHLAKLLARQLITVQKQGRHKYFQLHGSEVAALLETLLNLSANIDHSTVKTGPKDPGMRQARVCYDHLAGTQSVALRDSLLGRGILVEESGQLALTGAGLAWFKGRGVDIETLSKKPRPLCKNCLDWSERRHHLAGALGAWILSDLLEKKWVERDLDSRTVRFSDSGTRQFSKTYLEA